MVASVVVWVVLPVLPFLPISGQQKLGAAGAVLVLAEIFFWGGAAMAGPDAARRMRSWWKENASSPETHSPLPSALPSAAKLEDN